MGIQLRTETTNERTKQVIFDGVSCIEILDDKMPYFLKTNAPSLMEQCKFHGLESKSPHEHLEEFIVLCEFLKTLGV